MVSENEPNAKFVVPEEEHSQDLRQPVLGRGKGPSTIKRFRDLGMRALFTKEGPLSVASTKTRRFLANKVTND